MWNWAKAKTVEEACRALEITVQTYYRWRQKYGGMQPAMAKQLKALQKENSRLKKVVAEQVLDKDTPYWSLACRSVSTGGGWHRRAASCMSTLLPVR